MNSGDSNFDEYDLDIDSSPRIEEVKVNAEAGKLPENRLEERAFIQNMFKPLEKNRERLKGIIINIKVSRVFESAQETSKSKNGIMELERKCDEKVYVLYENIVNRFKEITTYPRPAATYSIGYSKAKKEKINSLKDEKLQMEYILSCEMQTMFYSILKNMEELFLEMREKLNSFSGEVHTKAMTPVQKRAFEDAKQSADFTYGEVSSLRTYIEKWLNRELY